MAKVRFVGPHSAAIVDNHVAVCQAITEFAPSSPNIPRYRISNVPPLTMLGDYVGSLSPGPLQADAGETPAFSSYGLGELSLA